MPTYEFRCPQGHDFEKFYRSISRAEAQSACPVCGQPAERVLSPTGFSFKGSGFYLTDYGKNAHREKPTASTNNGPEKSAEGGEGADAKPAAKNETAPPASKQETSKPAEAAPAPSVPKKQSGDA